MRREILRFGNSGGGLTAAVLAATLLNAGHANAEKPFDFAATPGKLPKTVVPSAYRIDLKPNLDSLAFTGTEEIDIAVAKPTDSITLNSNGLTIKEVTLKDGTKATVAIDEKAQTATFTSLTPWQPARIR